MLANLLNLWDVDFMSSEEIREAVKELCGKRVDALGEVSKGIVDGASPAGSWVDIPPYQGDALVRGSEPLSKTKDGRTARTVI